MAIVVTEQGLIALKNAEAGGFLLNLTDFKVAYEDFFDISISDTQLVGTVLFEGLIESVEALSGSSVRFSCVVPAGLPAQGSSWQINEIGIYTHDGVLFAHGKFDTHFVKTYEFGLKLYVIVSAGRLGEIIKITISETVSLPSTPHVRSLVPPSQALNNVVAVLDQETDADKFTSAGLAVKYGAGSLHWAFLGYTRVYNGTLDAVINQSLLEIDCTKHGFTLEDQEVAILQIVSGANAGESRRVSYDLASSALEVLEKPLTNVSSQSIVSIWKSLTKIIPNRENVPYYFMLGAGTNNYHKTVSQVSTITYTPGHVQYTNNGSSYTLPFVPVADDLVYVYANGILIEQTSYVISDDDISVSGHLGELIDIRYFQSSPSTGSNIVLYESSYDCDGTDSEFILPVIPESIENLWIFLDGELVATGYTLNSYTLAFTVAPIGRLNVLSNINSLEAATKTVVTSNSFTADGSTIEFVTSVPAYKNSLVFINGNYVERSNYSTANGTIQLSVAPANGSVVKVLIFTAEVLVVTQNESGIDSGMVWSDPAGVDPPNYLEQYVYSFVSNGTSRVYSVTEKPYKSTYILVFVNGVYQTTTTYSYDLDLNEVTLNTQPANGIRVDIVVYKYLDVGYLEQNYEQNVVVNNFVKNVGNSYTLNVTPSSKNEVLVFVDGTYVHQATYTITGNILSLVTAGTNIQVLIRQNVVINSNYQNLVKRVSFSLPSTTTAVVLPVSTTASMCNVFVNGVYRVKSSYSVAGVNLTITLGGSGTVTLDVFILTKAAAATRLMLRQEAIDLFVDKAGDTMTGFLTLHANPVNLMHATPKQYVDQKVADDIAAALNNYYDKPTSDGRFVNITGDTMTGDLILNRDPVGNLNAVTRQYVTNNYYTQAVSDDRFLNKDGDTMTANYLTLANHPTQDMHAATRRFVLDNIPAVPAVPSPVNVMNWIFTERYSIKDIAPKNSYEYHTFKTFSFDSGSRSFAIIHVVLTCRHVFAPRTCYYDIQCNIINGGASLAEHSTEGTGGSDPVTGTCVLYWTGPVSPNTHYDINIRAMFPERDEALAGTDNVIINGASAEVTKPLSSKITVTLM